MWSKIDALYSTTVESCMYGANQALVLVLVLFGARGGFEGRRLPKSCGATARLSGILSTQLTDRQRYISYHTVLLRNGLKEPKRQRVKITNSPTMHIHSNLQMSDCTMGRGGMCLSLAPSRGPEDGRLAGMLHIHVCLPIEPVTFAPAFCTVQRGEDIWCVDWLVRDTSVPLYGV